MVHLYCISLKSAKNFLKKIQWYTTLMSKLTSSRFAVDEEKEKIAAMGQRSDEKAKKWVQEEFKRMEKSEREAMERDIEILLGLSKGDPKYYFRYLTAVLGRFVGEEELPGKYSIETLMSDKGIQIKISGTKYQAAFKPSGLPVFDRNACKIMAVRIGNTVAKLEGFVKTSPGGIILPDEEDMKRNFHV